MVLSSYTLNEPFFKFHTLLLNHESTHPSPLTPHPSPLTPDLSISPAHYGHGPLWPTPIQIDTYERGLGWAFTAWKLDATAEGHPDAKYTSFKAAMKVR